MKTVYLVRHAKSSWDNAFTSDFDRPLNQRGRNNAPASEEGNYFARLDAVSR